jgi:hypothetical protein
MKTLEIGNAKLSRRNEVSELSVVVRWGAYSGREIAFRTSHSLVSSSCDPFVPAVLLPAMQRKLDIEIRGAVSENLLRAAERVEHVLAAWHPDWHPSRLSAKEQDHGDKPAAPGTQVGLFFSGGVDSFYTLLKHRAEITHLIFVAGFDIPLRHTALRQSITAEMRRTAEAIGLPLLEVETSLRSFSDGLSFPWEEQFGAAMAGVAHFLAPTFGRIYIPSGYALPFLVPHGSHPGLDPLWSSTSLELVHDGIEATRFDKIGALCASDVAVRNLRVCWQLKEGQYNCCRCRKCMWTMAFLRAHGALDRARTFSVPLDLRKLGESHFRYPEERYRFIQAIGKLEQRGDDHALANAMRAALRRRASFLNRLRHSLKQLRRRTVARLRNVVRAARQFASAYRAPTS